MISARSGSLILNTTAICISVVILIWSIITALLIPILGRKNSKKLIRDVNCLTDVPVLVTGSSKFLQLLRIRGVDSLNRDESAIRTTLGWFRGEDGKARWGVELTDGVDEAGSRNDVDKDRNRRAWWHLDRSSPNADCEVSGMVQEVKGDGGGRREA